MPGPGSVLGMSAHGVRSWLESLEPSVAEDPEAASVALAYVAGQRIDWDEALVSAALRRALFVLAAGGDPRRELHVCDRAVGSLAHELATEVPADALERVLYELRDEAAHLLEVSDLIDRLAADAHLAWACLACGLLADEVTEGG